MHSPNKRTWIPLVVLLGLSLAAARTADADRAKDKAKNRISEVGFADAGQETTIQIRGSATPTFTVYKLDRPTRVVVDIAGATLADDVREAQENGATLPVGTWAVNQLAAYELDDGGKLVRVVVTLARPGRYDVKADGSDVVVSVIARDEAPEMPDAAEIEAAQKAAEQAKKDSDAAKAARAKAEQAAAKAKDQADASKAEAEAAKRSLAEAQATAAKAEKKSKAERQQAAQALAEAKAEAERTRKAEAAAKAEAERTREAAEKADARAAKTRQVAERAKAELETMKQELAEAKAEAKRHQEAAAKAKAETKEVAADAKKAAADAKKDAERLEAEAEAARAEAKRALAEAEAARKAEADAKKAEADARKLAASAKKEAASAKKEAASAKQDAASAKQDAASAKQDAAAQKRDAEAARERAAADKRDAEAMRAEAERMLGEARTRLADAEAEAKAAKKSQEAALAARKKAEKTEEAARAAETKAAAERKAAEKALAAAEKARAGGDADAEKRIADAEARLAKAEKARAAAEDQRKAAEVNAEEARALAARRKAETDDAVAAKTAAEREKKAAAAAAREAEERAARAETLRKEEAAAARAAAEAKAALAAAEKAKASKKEIEAKRAEAKRLKKDADQARKAREDEETQLAAIVAERRAVEAELADARKAAAAARKDAAAAEKRAAAARKEAEDAEARARAARADAETAKQEAKAARVAKKEPSFDSACPERGRCAAESKGSERAEVAKKPKKVAKAIAVEDVMFQQHGDEARVIVEMTGQVEPEVRTSGSRVEMVLAGVDLPKKLERKLDVSKFDGAVRAVSSYRDTKDPSKVRVVVDLDDEITPKVERTGNTLRMTFAGAAVVAKKPARTRAKAKKPVKATSIPAPVVGGYGASSQPVTSKSVAQAGSSRRKVYRGPTIDLDFKDADIHNLLRFLANIGRVSIVVPDDIKATVTVRLKRVPWDQALEVILASKGLWYRKEGNLYRVAPRKVLDAEDQAEAERIRAAVQSEVPEAEVFTLNYADADEIQEKLAPLLSPKGKIEVDERTNSLIINDIRSHRRRVIDLADRLDIQTPQIMIEARIVEARSTYARDIGIQWGGNANASQAGGNATGLIFPNSIGIAGGNEDRQTPTGGVATPSDFAVNLPAATGTGAGGAIGISLGSVGGNFNLNLRLSALEDSGSVRIISQPKITVLNNAQAEISQGQSIPISVVSAQGTQTQFVPAELRLTVTPYVSQGDCAIAMDVEVTKNEPDFVNTGARGDPTILTKEARTKVLVADGETTVLGGITTRNSGIAYSKVPFFGDLPVLGWFFKRRLENDDRTELLIFITPRITNKAFLRCE